MGEVMDQSGQIFCSGYIVHTIFWNPQRMSLNMQVVWPSPIMLPIMLKGHEMFVDTCEFVVGFNYFSCLFMSFAVH